MSSERLKRSLDDNGVPYLVTMRSAAANVSELRIETCLGGCAFVKTVPVTLDGKPAIVAVPHPEHVDLDMLAAMSGVEAAKLASNEQLESWFPGYAADAIPPFGNLWGLPVYASLSLSAGEWIAFRVGTRRTVVALAFDDFKRLAEPHIRDLSNWI